MLLEDKPIFNMMKKSLRPWFLALAVFIVLVLASLSREYQMVDDRLFDWLSTTAAPIPEDSPIILVGIDESSFRELGLQWPWPREVHGALVDALTRAGASVIALDILFAEPSDPEADQALAAAVRKAPPVVLAAEEALEENPYVSQLIRIDPLDSLLNAGAVPGVAAVTLSHDNILRRLPLRPDGFALATLNQWQAVNKTAKINPAVTRIKSTRYLQFFGPSGSYPTVSYYQALAPEEFLSPGRFKDRVVFVGLAIKTSPENRSGQADAYATPSTRSSGTMMAGVEVQATIFDNLRLGLFIRPMPYDVVLICLAVFILMLMPVFRSWQPWSSTIRLLALAAAISLGTFFLLQYGRVWLSPSLFLLAVFMMFIGRGALAFIEEQAGRRYIKQAFSRYLSPALVDQLASDRSQLVLGGEMRSMTILFCDVRGFTTLSERYADDPRGLVQVMNRLFTALTAVIMKHGGTVDKYIGDCIMAFWNAPLEDPDHGAHACSAALEMIDAVNRLNREFKDGTASPGSPAPQLDIGIGINTGTCVVGNIGSEQRFDYSVLGDPVNLASRLEGQSKNYGTRIVIGPETAAMVPDFALLELDLIAVKGKTRAMRVFALRGGPETKNTNTFIDLQTRHKQLLGCFRGRAWKDARAALADCRNMAPDLTRLHECYEQRIDYFEANPPDDGWTGIYRAETK